MSINFAALQGLSIPEGMVTQIADANGRVLWSASIGDMVDKGVLLVKKVTHDTYAGETTYEGESFILLDIYPKTNGTVTVTYGNLTKTITDTSGAERPNAQQVFFGTFNGVSDSVETPANGKVIIEGDYYAFGCSSFRTSKYMSSRAGGVTNIRSFGKSTVIPSYAFGDPLGACALKGSIRIPDTVQEIGDNAFYGCVNPDLFYPVVVGAGVTSIGDSAFSATVAGYKSIKLLPVVPPALGVNSDGTYKNFGYIYTNSETGSTTDYRTEKIIVPKGCGNTYKAAAGWSFYADKIEEAT